jgi:PadR family transcriptional regulator PadR
LRKGLLDFCVLNALKGGESYGYELIQRLKRLDELAIAESTVYPILNRLRKDRFVKIRMGASPTGPPRRYFSLTALGNHHLKALNAYWDDLCRSIENLRNAEPEQTEQ